jgi:hypothetical protein
MTIKTARIVLRTATGNSSNVWKAGGRIAWAASAAVLLRAKYDPALPEVDRRITSRYHDLKNAAPNSGRRFLNMDSLPVKSPLIPALSPHGARGWYLRPSIPGLDPATINQTNQPIKPIKPINQSNQLNQSNQSNQSNQIFFSFNHLPATGFPGK